MSTTLPRWLLFRLQLRRPVALPVALLTASGVAFDPSYMGVASIPLLLIALPFLVATRRSAFESALPVCAKTSAQARVLAALSIALPSMLIAMYASVRQLNDAPPVLATLGASLGFVALLVLMFGRRPADELIATPFAALRRRMSLWSASSPGLEVRSNSLWWPTLRSVLTLPLGGMVLLSYFAGYVGLEWTWIVYLALFTVLSGMLARRRLAWRNALPIAPWRTMHLVFAPTLVLCVIAFAAESTRVHYAEPHRRSLTEDAPHYKEDETFDRRTKVSVRYWQPLAPDAPRRITAPWGETIVPDTLRLLGVTLHNPYSADSTRSADFVDWQFRRATMAVYGRESSLEEYKAVDYTRRQVPIVQRLPFQLIRGGLALSLVVGILLVMECLRSRRAPLTSRTRGMIAGVFVLVAFSPTWLNVFLLVTRGTKILGESVDALLLRLFAAFPDLFSLFAALAFLPALVLYLLLQRQFARAS